MQQNLHLMDMGVGNSETEK